MMSKILAQQLDYQGETVSRRPALCRPKVDDLTESIKMHVILLMEVT